MGSGLVLLPFNFLCGTEQSQVAVVCRNAFHRVALADGFETTAAFPTVPNMMDLPLFPILGPIGSNQLIAALHAARPKTQARIGHR